MLTRVVSFVAVLLGFVAPCNARPNRETEKPAVETPAAGAKILCPMKCEGEKTYARPGRCPVCRMKLNPVPAGPELTLTPMKPPVVAGGPGELQVQVERRAEGTPLSSCSVAGSGVGRPSLAAGVAGGRE